MTPPTTPSIEECVHHVERYWNVKCKKCQEVLRILRAVKEARKDQERWNDPIFQNDACMQHHCDGCERSEA